MYIYIYVYIYMVTRSAAPTPLPPKSQWSGYRVGPPSLWCGVWGPSSPCGVVVGFWGLGFSLSFCVLGLLEGIRLRVDKCLGRICGVCSALGLEPACRRGLGLGVGFKVHVKVNQNRSTRYVIGFTACEGLACEPWPPPQHAHHPVAAPTPFPHTPAAPPPPPNPYQTHQGGGPGTPNAWPYIYIYTHVYVKCCSRPQLETVRREKHEPSLTGRVHCCSKQDGWNFQPAHYTPYGTVRQLEVNVLHRSARIAIDEARTLLRIQYLGWGGMKWDICGPAQPRGPWRQRPWGSSITQEVVQSRCPNVS